VSLAFQENCIKVAFMLSASYGLVECMRTMLNDGRVADVNMTDRDGHTAYDRARSGNHIECMNLLEAAGATVSVSESGSGSTVVVDDNTHTPRTVTPP